MSNMMMIDIETLGVSRDSVILSAACVIFTEESVRSSSHYYMDIREQIQQGRTISTDTVRWWLMTDRATFGGLCGLGTSIMKDLEKDICRLYSTYDVKKVWSRGSMDLEILKDCFEVPWRYNQERDVRTLDEFGSMEPNGHDALADCLNQIDFVQSVLKREKRT